MKFKRIKEILSDVKSVLTHKRLSWLQRSILLFYYIKVVIFNFLNGRVKTFTHIKFLGFTVYFSSFSEFSILVHEIFIEDPYYFKSDNNNPKIIDCGGNIGMSMLYFKWIYPESIITVFEPVPLACKILQKNIDNNNLQGVTLVEKALSNEDGVAIIYMREEITLAATMEKREAHGSGECQIQTVRLSDYIDSEIDFLKIDVQFSEQKVFEDLANSGDFNYIKQLVMEFHHYYGYKSNSFSKTLGYLEQSNLHYNLDLNCRKTKEFASYMLTAYKMTY